MKYYLVSHKAMDEFLANEIRNASDENGKRIAVSLFLVMKLVREVCKEFPFEYAFQTIINRFEDTKRLAEDGLKAEDFHVEQIRCLGLIRANAEDMIEMVERWRSEYSGSGVKPESREKSREEELNEETIRALQEQVEPTKYVKETIEDLCQSIQKS